MPPSSIERSVEPFITPPAFGNGNPKGRVLRALLHYRPLDPKTGALAGHPAFALPSILLAHKFGRVVWGLGVAG